LCFYRRKIKVKLISTVKNFNISVKANMM